MLREESELDAEQLRAELRLCGLRSLATLGRALAGRSDLTACLEAAARCRLQLLRQTAAPGATAPADEPEPEALAAAEARVARLRAAGAHSRLERLRRVLALDDLELHLLMTVGLANELDSWAALFTLLGGSPWPRVHHLLDLVSPAFGRAPARRALAEGALTRHQLLRVEPLEAPFASRVACLDSHSWESLLGLETVPPLLRAHSRPAGSARPPVLPVELADRVEQLAAQARTGRVLRVVLHGPPGIGRRTVARHLAPSLIELQLPAAPPPGWGAEAVRHALTRGAALLLAVEVGPGDPIEIALDLPPGLSAFVVAPDAAEVRGPSFADAVRLRLPRPALTERTRLWSAALAEEGLQALDASELARGYQMGGGEIVATARTAALLHGPTASRSQLGVIVRDQPAAHLDSLVRGRRPSATWDDLLLPPKTLAVLREMAGRVRHRDRVFAEWRIAAASGVRMGLLSLFAGTTGTGKTLAAEVIAHHLELDLYCIDLSMVVSKYIGETEKSLSRIFDAVEGAPAVLFFDEADSLFGKRTETRDAHDRYANLEVSYLLARLERFSGIAILASNFRQNIDAAFLRRIDYLVEFPAPDVDTRRRIWERHLRCDAPLSRDISAARLAEDFPVSGAHIRNAIVGAAFAAASEDKPIQQAHLLAAMRREYEKLGKAFPAAR